MLCTKSIHYLYVSEIQSYFSSLEEINIGIKGPKGRQKETEDKGREMEGREIEGRDREREMEGGN